MAFRNLRRRRSRNTLTIIAIMLGVSLLIGISIASSSGMAEFSKYLSRIWGETDLIIRYGNRMPFDERNITIVEGVAEVQKSVVRVNWHARLENDTKKVAGLMGIDTNNDWEFADYNISGSREIHGTSVVVGSMLAENYGLKIGDTFNLTIRAYNTETWNRTYHYSIIGIYYPTPPVSSVDVFTTLAEVQDASGLSGMISTILAKLKDASTTAIVRDQFQDSLGLEFEVLAPKIEAQKRMEEMATGFQAGLTVLMLIALLVSGFLVFNTMFMSVYERTYEIGVLRAIGSSRRQIFFTFFSESLILGLIGASLGIPVGLTLSSLFTFLFEKAFGLSKITILVTVDACIGGFIGGTVTTMIGAVYPAVSASRANVIQALRPISRTGRRAVSDVAVLIIGLVLLVTGSALTVQLIPHVEPFMGFLDIFLVPIGVIIMVAVLLKRGAGFLANPIGLVSSSIGTLLSKTLEGNC